MSANRKGFTLVEVIIAIAAMAVLGGFVMQLFILSQQINRSATHTDKALERAGGVVSEFKRSASPEEFWEAVPDGDDRDGNARTLYFDADWNPCAREGAGLIMSIRMSPAGDPTAAGCVDLEVSVIDATVAGQMEELVRLRAARYFAVPEAGDAS